MVAVVATVPLVVVLLYSSAAPASGAAVDTERLISIGAPQHKCTLHCSTTITANTKDKVWKALFLRLCSISIALRGHLRLFFNLTVACSR